MTADEVVRAVADDLYADEMLDGESPEPPLGLTSLADPFLTTCLEGRTAGRDGKPLSSNPHKPGTWWYFLHGGAMLDEILERR